MGRPHVVVHVAVSVDGATTGFDADIATYYRLAATWREDVTLTGADTVLLQEEALAAAPAPGPDPDAALLVVVDSRARVHAWTALRDSGYWSGVLRAVAGSTPPRPVDPAVEELVVGDDRVDLGGLLEALGARPGVDVVRVDSGGSLTGALLREGLVDEISLLVHPAFSAAGGRSWFGADRPPGAPLELEASEQLPDGLVWLRYRVAR